MRHNWRRRVRIVLIAAGTLVVLAGAAGTFYYMQIWRPRKLMTDMDWYSKASPADQLGTAYKVLRWGSEDDHDAFVVVLRLGGPDSVPYLMAGLRRQPHTGQDGVMCCTKSHCLEALQQFTNHDLGLNYEDWIGWWKQNRRKSHEEWILSGFADNGLPVCNPPDDRFACALIEQMPKQGRRQTNAWHLLSRLPAEQLDRCLDRCMNDHVSALRRGAAETLTRQNTPMSRAKLRALCRDADPQIRELSLSRLNQLLRGVRVPAEQDAILWRGKMGEGIIAVVGGNQVDRLLVAIETQRGKTSQLVGFDLPNRRTTWSFSCSAVISAIPLLHDGRIYFWCGNGRIYCLDANTGACLWEQPTDGYMDSGPPGTPVLAGDILIVPEEKSLRAFRLEDGQPCWRLPVTCLPGAMACSDGFVYAADKDFLLKIDPTGHVVSQAKVPATLRSVVARKDTIYVAAGGNVGPGYVVAYSAGTLAEMWRHATLGDGSAAMLFTLPTSQMLVVCDYNSLVALDPDNGKCLWSCRNRAEPPLQVVGDKIVTYTYRGAMEVHDSRTGEILAFYTSPRVFKYPFHATTETIACGDTDGNLFILRMPDNGATSQAD